MSIVFTKNQDQSQVSGRPSGLLPYRWSNYFTQPLKIPPNSQVAYISSTFNLNQNGNIQDNPMYMTIGEPALNMPIPLIPPERFVDSWKDEVNFLAELANQYGTDSDYNDIFNLTNKIYEDEFQKTFSVFPITDDVSVRAGVNIFYRSDDKVDIFSNARPFQATQFNQGFNCLGRNPLITYDSGETYTSGLNTRNSNYNEASHVKSNATGSDGAIWSNSVSFIQPNVDSADDADNPSTLSNFYNTQYSYNVANNNDYLWGQTSAQSLVLPDFDEIAFASTISSTGIKKYIGDVVPTKNGGGHAGIGSGDEYSGGYAIYGFGNQSQTAANTHFDEIFVGDAADVGFCGIAEQFVGVHSIPFIQSFGEDLVGGYSFTGAAQEFTDLIDINSAPDGNLPEGTFARYLMGLKIFEDGDGAGGGTLKVQAQVLNPHAELADSKYIDVGGTLDIKALSNGVNTAVTPNFTFDSTNDYVFNTYNYAGSRLPAMLMFRFRWSSPYTMAVDYTMTISNDETSYNTATDIPYVAQPYPAAGNPTPVDNPVEVRLDNTTDGDVKVLQNIDGAGTVASEINFYDSGGAGGDYTPNELYTIDFDMGSGFQAKLTFNTFEFEHATFAMYDRLGIQVSNDGTNWINFSGIPWMNKSANGTPPYSTSYGGSTQSSSGSFGTDGYILPQNISQAQTYDPTAQFPYIFQTAFRYIRFNFLSDGSAQRAGWDITIEPNTPYQTTTVANADPRVGWVKLYDMLDDYATQNVFYIPSYLGDIGLVSYHVADNTSHYTKGYYDVRRSYRYFERLAENATSSKSYTSLQYYNRFFKNDGLWDESLLQKNDSGFTTPKLVGVEPETFEGDDAGVDKLPFLLVNTIKNEIDNIFAYDVNYDPMFQVREPLNLEMGYILGWVKGNATDAGVLLAKDAAVDYQTSFMGINTIQLSDSAFSNHIQITNLPIQSQNGVVSSQNKLIYVVNSLGVNSVQTDTSYRIYNDTSPVLLWVDLNNFQELNINRLDMLITDDANRPQKLLVGTTDVVLMFRQKPEASAGYLPNNIPVKMGNNLY